MRILCLEQHPRFIGGSERLTLSICRHAISRGHSCWLAYATPGDMVHAYTASGAQCHQLPVFTLAVRRPYEAWRSLRSVATLVRHERIDLVFTSQVSYASLLAATAAWTGVKTAMHLGLTYDYPSPVFRNSIRFIGLGVAPSAATADGWRARGWPAASLQVIPNGVDTGTFSSGDGRTAARKRIGADPQGPPIIAYVGRLVAEKGIFTLIRAFGQYRREGGQARLLLVGEAPHDEVAQLAQLTRAERLDASDWEVRSATSTPEDVYRAADIVVVPSEWEEAFGLVPIEAMSCGTLAIVSNRGILPEFVTPVGEDAIFPSGDVGRLAGRIDWWLQNPRRRDAAAALLQDYIRKHYSLTACGDAYLAAFSELVTR